MAHGLVALLVAPAPVAAQRSPAPAPALPTSGVDYSGVDQFWKVVDILARDSEPSEAQWSALFSTPGYRLATVNLGAQLRDDIDVTFKPSRRAEFQRLTAGDGERALQLRHLALAETRRAELRAYRDSLARTTPIADAVARASRLLPAGATNGGAPPLVAFAIFKDDGFSLPGGIVVDLLYARIASKGGVPLTTYLAHEFHHSFVDRLAGSSRPKSMNELMEQGMNGTVPPDAGLRRALYELRNEGIADQIDKPYPFSSPNAGLAAYVARYNREYARTPDVVRVLDSLLTAVARDSTKMAAVSDRAMGLFWSNGHPNGAYIAREIQETFGADSLRSASLSPAVFLRQYAAAEHRRGRPAPFTADAWRVIVGLDARATRARAPTRRQSWRDTK